MQSSTLPSSWSGDITTRLSAMHRQVELGRDPAQALRCASPTDAACETREDANLIENLCGRMELALAEIEGQFQQVQSRLDAGTIDDRESLEGAKTSMVSAIKRARIQLDRLLSEGLEHWETCPSEAEYAWLQFNAHFDMLGEHLNRMSEIVSETFDRQIRRSSTKRGDHQLRDQLLGTCSTLMSLIRSLYPSQSNNAKPSLQ